MDDKKKSSYLSRALNGFLSFDRAAITDKEQLGSVHAEPDFRSLGIIERLMALHGGSDTKELTAEEWQLLAISMFHRKLMRLHSRQKNGWEDLPFSYECVHVEFHRDFTLVIFEFTHKLDWHPVTVAGIAKRNRIDKFSYLTGLSIAIDDLIYKLENGYRAPLPDQEPAEQMASVILHEVLAR